MGANVQFDLSEAREFFAKVRAAGNGDLHDELVLFLEGLGNEFLRLIEDEIVRRKVIDTRNLLASFHKGSSDGVWELDEGSLTLEVGTSVHYASYVNDGHWTNPKGQKGRFVPGTWGGDTFEYDPDAKGGMYLKQKWVTGKHYWESGLRILERIYPKLLEAKLQQWIDKYFS